MSSESVCQVARNWVDMGSFHTRLVVRFMIFTVSVQSILDTPSYSCCQRPGSYGCKGNLPLTHIKQLKVKNN
jgi:hypothetical protein